MEGAIGRHTYGAESFNENYPKQAILSFLSASFVILLLFAYPLIKAFVNHSEDERPIKIKAKRTINYSELSAPPPIDLERQEIILKAAPKLKVTKFLQPVAKKDEEVEDIVEVPTMEELENSEIGTVDQDGIDSVIFDGTDVVTLPPEEVLEGPLSFVEVMPEFVGGQEALLEYLAEEIIYPPIAKEAGIQGRVYVQFVVEKDGSISEVKLVRGVHESLDKEALRVITEMDKWTPGSQNGRTARVLFTIPIRFALVQE
jgi:protein TonB